MEEEKERRKRKKEKRVNNSEVVFLDAYVLKDLKI